MKCKYFEIHIDDFLNAQLSDNDLSDFELHMLNCKDCAEKLRVEEGLISGLKKLPVEPASEDFDQRVFAEVRRQYSPATQNKHGYRFAAGFATAAIASLAIWFVSSVYILDPLVEQPEIVFIEMNESQTVRLMFESPADIQQVHLSIGLPENMQLDGYPGQRELSWQTSLLKGQNVLALPIMAIGKGQGELFAQLSYGDKTKTFKVVLKTTINEAQLYQLNEAKLIQLWRLMT
jgi:hypothetical protein